MLEYIFRGRTNKEGRWVSGPLIMDKEGGCAIIEPIENAFSGIIDGMEISMPMTVKHIRVEPATIGIHSGLTDANGKVIFEGDILENDKERYVVLRDKKLPALKAVSAFAWTMQRHHTSFQNTEWLYANAHCMRIIGNIHDSPELMEVKIPGKKTLI